MKILLTTMAIIETLAGILIIAAPSFFVSLLLGQNSLDMATLAMARIPGAAMITLGIICWSTRKSELSISVLKAMLFYNFAITAVLLYAKLGLDVHANGLVPATVLHFTITVWCIFALRHQSVRSKSV
jgi:hypothetical protein